MDEISNGIFTVLNKESPGFKILLPLAEQYVTSTILSDSFIVQTGDCPQSYATFAKVQSLNEDELAESDFPPDKSRTTLAGSVPLFPLSETVVLPPFVTLALAAASPGIISKT